ncbi:unnamed protein product [Moneuplotes crassus]|uniref:Uncharacterized protein n=1 Tax=Euplotes crassus TaxID=5936 RepID=A0AAD1X8S2_EUPCR|nr:unnamed protein product [Moneuplotes crassus]
MGQAACCSTRPDDAALGIGANLEKKNLETYKPVLEKIRKYEFECEEDSKSENQDTQKESLRSTARVVYNLNEIFNTDMGEQMIREFKNFIFLVKLHNQEYKVEMTRRITKKKNFQEELKTYEPLIPSPIVDKIWCCIISMGNAYEKFCESTFDSYLHRKDPMRENATNTRANYAYTYKLLKQYNEIIDPDYQFWPDLDVEDYAFEHINFVHVDINRVREIDFSGVNPQIMSVSQQMANANKLRQKLIQKGEGDYDDKILFESMHVKTPQGAKSIHRIYRGIKRANTKYEAIQKRLVLKFLITKDTATVWMEEFHKYLIIVAYFDKDIGSMMPSQTLKIVWETYREFTQNWTNICHSLLDNNDDAPKEAFKIYTDTGPSLPSPPIEEKSLLLSKAYEEMFKKEPPEDIWQLESRVDQKFICINLFRTEYLSKKPFTKITDIKLQHDPMHNLLEWQIKTL